MQERSNLTGEAETLLTMEGVGEGGEEGGKHRLTQENVRQRYQIQSYEILLSHKIQFSNTGYERSYMHYSINE